MCMSINNNFNRENIKSSQNYKKNYLITVWRDGLIRQILMMISIVHNGKY